MNTGSVWDRMRQTETNVAGAFRDLGYAICWQPMSGTGAHATRSRWLAGNELPKFGRTDFAYASGPIALAHDHGYVVAVHRATSDDAHLTWGSYVVTRQRAEYLVAIAALYGAAMRSAWVFSPLSYRRGDLLAATGEDVLREGVTTAARETAMSVPLTCMKRFDEFFPPVANVSLRKT